MVIAWLRGVSLNSPFSLPWCGMLAGCSCLCLCTLVALLRFLVSEGGLSQADARCREEWQLCGRRPTALGWRATASLFVYLVLASQWRRIRSCSYPLCSSLALARARACMRCTWWPKPGGFREVPCVSSQLGEILSCFWSPCEVVMLTSMSWPNSNVSNYKLPILFQPPMSTTWSIFWLWQFFFHFSVLNSCIALLCGITLLLPMVVVQWCKICPTKKQRTKVSPSSHCI